jgi:hypothetical protein
MILDQKDAHEGRELAWRAGHGVGRARMAGLEGPRNLHQDYRPGKTEPKACRRAAERSEWACSGSLHCHRALYEAANGGAVAGAFGQRVCVLSTTDQAAVRPLIDAFERRHAGLRVDYRELGNIELIESFLSDGGSSADVLWSSAMDLQIKLVNDSHAQPYVSPHAPQLPRWAVWKHEAYGTTYEPVGERAGLGFYDA